VERALQNVRRSRLEEYPSTTIAFAMAARSRSTKGRPGARRSASPGAQRCGRGLTYALPYFAVHTRLELRGPT
jgi:hypothetical protein